MPTYPGTTLSNLKTATGIASNALLDQAPGTPTKVLISDFLIDAVGNRVEDAGGTTYEATLPVVGDPGKMYPGIVNDIQDFRIQVSQANLANPGAQGGSGGRFFYEQILKPSLAVTAGTLQGWDVLANDPSQDDFLNFEITLRATGTAGIAGDFTFNGSFNDHAINWQGGVSFAYTNVATEPAAALFTWSQSSGTAEVEYYDPNDEVDLDYAQFNMSESLTSPSGQGSFNQKVATFSWDPSQQQISGTGDLGVTCYDTSGSVAPNGSLSGPSTQSGTIDAT